MLKKGERLIWADQIRIFAVIAVIIVHSSDVSREQSIVSVPWILFAIGKTGVPLFVMLSGALLLKKIEPYSVFMSKRFKHLFAPWILWTIILIVIQVITTKQNIFYLATTPEIIVSTFMTGYWFLPMITCLYLLTPFFRYFTVHAKERDFLWIITLWFVSVCLIPYIHNSASFPLHTDNGLIRQTLLYSGYYIIGYFLSQHSPISRWIAFSMIGVGIVGSVIFSHYSNTLIFFDYTSPFIFLSSVGIFIAMLRRDYYNIGSSMKAKLLLVCSNASLGVIFIHSFVIRILMNLNVIAFDATLNLIIYITLTSLISFSCIILFQQFPVSLVLDKIKIGKYFTTNFSKKNI